MSQETWSAVDRYISERLVPEDEALQAALASSARAALPEIQVAANQGSFLQMLLRVQGARRVLELGTLGGYSTIWLARGLPAGGRLVTIEYEPKHAEVARENIARAGLEKVVELRVGAALEILPQLAEGGEPFDFVFIDADKENYPGYFEWALKLARVGTVIIADNVIRQGGILDPQHSDPRVRGVQRLYEMMANEPRVSATALQTVGGKGYDGFAMALVVA